MSEMKALDKLRNLKTFGSVKVSGDLVTTNMLMACATMGEINEIADEIEAEIADNYMLLPVDADGVPIRVGDVIQFRNDSPITVDSIGTSRVYESDWGFFGSNGGFYGQGTMKNVRHVKPRTLEDVLIEYRLKAYNLYLDDEMTGDERVDEFKKLDAEYDSEIRELFGGDAE